MLNLDDAKMIWNVFTNVCGVIGFLLWVPFIWRWLTSYFRLSFKYRNLSFVERFSFSKEECIAINWISSVKPKLVNYGNIKCELITVPDDKYHSLQSSLTILATKGYISDGAGLCWGGNAPYRVFVITEKFNSTFLWKEYK